MKALKINKSGWLWEFARLGGMPQDGMVPDKANLKYNRLIRAKYDAEEITYVEMKTEMKDSERQIDFCDFTRYCVFALLKSLFMLGVLGATATFVVAPIVDFLYWVVAGFINHFWPARTKFQQLGGIVLSLGSAFAVIMSYVGFHEEVNNFIQRKWQRVFVPKSYEQKQQQAINKAQSAYNRAEMYKAFRDSLKGKTCFKMEITD